MKRKIEDNKQQNHQGIQMVNTCTLKTLGDYRRVAQESLYEDSYPPKKRSGTLYDAVKTALYHTQSLINFSRHRISQEQIWSSTLFPDTEYELKNPNLFDCVKLTEFANTYANVKTVYNLLSSWPKYPGNSIKLFRTSGGLSYLDTAFDLVRSTGERIALGLRNTYRRQKRREEQEERRLKKLPEKVGNVVPGVFEFLHTPEANSLSISPEPEIIIRNWFDAIIQWMQEQYPNSEFSSHEVEAQFKTVHKQLEYEWGQWNSDDVNETIEIRDKLSKGSSKQLLRDLESCPSGVIYNDKLHGKKQPGTLKESLARLGYENYCKFFHKDGKRIYCDKNIHLI